MRGQTKGKRLTLSVGFLIDKGHTFTISTIDKILTRLNRVIGKCAIYRVKLRSWRIGRRPLLALLLAFAV